MTARKFNARRGFTLVEILIVVIILGILAAIVIPQFTNASNDARKGNIMSQLQTLRAQIQLYKLQHKETFPDLAASGHEWEAFTLSTDISGNTNATPSGTFAYGPYYQHAPVNPFSGTSTIAAAPGAGVGWVYNSTTGAVYATGTVQTMYFNESDGTDAASPTW